MIERIEKIDGIHLRNDLSVMDIETAGLVRQRDPIFIIGFLQNLDGQAHFYQYAIHSQEVEKEKDLLKQSIQAFEDKTLISFNGDRFDIPYIQARMEVQNMEKKDFQSLDLYRWIQRRQKFFDFENLKLKTLEKEAGIQREDQLSGEEVAKAFQEVHKDQDLFEKVLLHNKEDILYTYELLPYYQKLEDKLSFKLDLDSESYRFTLAGYKQEKDFAYIRLESNHKAQLPLRKSSSFGQVHWTDRLVQIRVPIHLGNFNQKTDTILQVAVSPKLITDQSSLALRAPFLLLSNGKKHCRKNILALSEVLLLL